MPNTKFTDAGQAYNSLINNKFTYTEWVAGQGAKTKSFAQTEQYLRAFATVAAFLCNDAQFEAALGRVSSSLWDAYRTFEPRTRNKFSRSLNKVAGAKGFTFQNRYAADACHTRPIGVKLVGGDPQLGYMLRRKLFWKDSMDLRHGEYSHCLQWLAIAEGLPTLAVSAADLYVATADFRAASKQDGNKGQRSVTMWQWVVDCFPTDMNNLVEEFQHSNETLESQSYRSPQVIMDFLLKNSGGPIPGHFLSNYLFYRYKNRNWLTRKTSWSEAKGEFEEYDKLYSGDPKVTRHGSVGVQTWAQSPTVATRKLRDPAQYQGQAPSAPEHVYPMTFHNRNGSLCYFYAE
jgi:hypothetical protein